MVRASLGGALGCVLLALVLGSSSVDFGAPPASFYPRFNPFFFLCTHHGELEGAGVAEGGGEVLLTLQITGNPIAYTPGQEYQGEHTHYSVHFFFFFAACKGEDEIYHLINLLMLLMNKISVLKLSDCNFHWLCKYNFNYNSFFV